MQNKYTATCANCKKPVLAGTGKTNKVNDYWKTEHLSQSDCNKAAGAKPGQFVGSNRYYLRDPFYDEFDPYFDFTSDDFNPNEGSKG